MYIKCLESLRKTFSGVHIGNSQIANNTISKGKLKATWALENRNNQCYFAIKTSSNILIYNYIKLRRSRDFRFTSFVLGSLPLVRFW